MNNDIVNASVKLSPSAAVSAGSAAGWLEMLNSYGQAVVIVLTIIYTALQIYFLIRNKGQKKPKE